MMITNMQQLFSKYIQWLFAMICALLSMAMLINNPIPALTQTADKPSKQRAAPQPNTLLLTAQYLVTVNQQIQKIWDVSEISIMELHNRSAVAQLWIDRRGRLHKYKLTQSSGLKVFDQSLIKAIRKAPPFPAPHKAIRNAIFKGGIEITFRRRVFRKKLLPIKRKYRDTTVMPEWPSTPQSPPPPKSTAPPQTRKPKKR
jgi:TonB family protein